MIGENQNLWVMQKQHMDPTKGFRVLLLATLIQTYVSVIGFDKMRPHFLQGG
jgi:hypothetical protein